MRKISKEVVEIRIDSKGNYVFAAKEGFAGASCVERTRDLELSLNGRAVNTEKTNDYYKPDESDPLKINIK